MTKLIPSLCLVAFMALPLGAERASDKPGGLYVKRAVDGDTLLLSDQTRVRLIGIDTPESHASKKLKKDAVRNKKDAKTIQQQGSRSTQFVKKIIEGKKIRRVYEKGNRVSGHTDRYGRTLAYIYFANFVWQLY